jgi:succinate dehydrogenase/fumarate reductase flavoprotein subunit
VVLVDKARAGTSGPTAFAAGDILCWFPAEDPLEQWVQAYLDAGGGLNSSSWLTAFLEGQYRLVLDLVRQGFPFVRDDGGQFVRRSGRGPLVKTVLSPMLEFQKKNRQLCLDLGVRVLDRVDVVEVICRQGEPAGVAGFDVYSGDLVLVEARAVVISAGGCSYRGPFFGQDVVSGEGVAMAMEAGARLAYMEYGNHYNVSLADFDTYGQSKFMAHGGKYVNHLGEAFLERPGTAGHRASGNQTVMAMVKEVWAGRGPVYMDLSGYRERLLAEELMPNLILALKDSGLDIFGRNEVIPAFTGTSNASGAGVWIDKEGQTTVPGLFAAGDTASKGLVIGSCVGISGVSLAWANFTGNQAGVSAAGYALERGPSGPPEDTGGLAHRILNPLGRSSARGPREILLSLGEEMARVDVSLIRSEKRMLDSLAKVRRWQLELSTSCGAADPHDLVIWYEAKGAATVAEATLLASLERRESRGGHCREDYPAEDPAFDMVLGVEKKDGGKHVMPIR